jgi:phosphatidylserine decarboxylase
MPSLPKLTDEHHDAATKTLDDVTSKAGQHSQDPKEHLHVPAGKEHAHKWFREVFPYDSLEQMESQWHLGNYVIDRQTG